MLLLGLELVVGVGMVTCEEEGLSVLLLVVMTLLSNLVLLRALSSRERLTLLMVSSTVSGQWPEAMSARCVIGLPADRKSVV